MDYEVESPNKKLLCNEVEFFEMANINWETMATHPHVHDAVELIYLTRGNLQISINGIKSDMSPGDLALFNSGAIHEIWTKKDEKNDYFVLKIALQALYAHSSQEHGNKFALRFSTCNPTLKSVWRKEEIEGTNVKFALDRLSASLNAKSKATNYAKILLALLILEGLYSSDLEASKKMTVSYDNLSPIIFYINEHYSEQITIEQLLSMSNMSQSKFSRLFKSTTGKSFKDYLNTVRTNKAEALIKNTNMPIREISVKVGYNNISNFISTYKKYKGNLPSNERK